MATFLAMLAAGLGTYAIRLTGVVASPSGRLLGWLEPRLRLVAPAALGALVTGAMFVDAGRMQFPPMLELAAVGCAMVATRRSGNLAIGLALGFPVYWAGAVIGLT